MEKEYTFQEWDAGKICLEFSTINNKNETNFPLRVKWEQIKESDIPLIKQKRKDLFELSVLLLLNKLKSQFENDAIVTKSLEHLFNRLIEKYEEILFDELTANTIYVTLKIDNTVFQYNHYLDIKNYATNHILLSKDIEYDFVHSSNCSLNSTENLSPEIEAEAYYRFLVWLKEERLVRKNTQIQGNKIKL